MTTTGTPCHWDMRRTFEVADEREARPIQYEVDDIEGEPDWVMVREYHCAAYRMRRVDAIPCTVCSLRGHVAGDPELCRRRVEVVGLGSAAWMSDGGGVDG